MRHSFTGDEGVVSILMTFETLIRLRKSLLLSSARGSEHGDHPADGRDANHPPVSARLSARERARELREAGGGGAQFTPRSARLTPRRHLTPRRMITPRRWVPAPQLTVTPNGGLLYTPRTNAGSMTAHDQAGWARGRA